jgi:hypothetical protein
MNNGHNDVVQAIRSVPFVFSSSSFLATGFSRLRLFRVSDAREESVPGTCEKIGFTDFSTTHFQ